MSRQRSLFEFANINLCRVCIEGRQDGKIANVTPQRFIEYGAVSHMEPARLLIAHAQLNIGAAMKAKSYFRNQSSFRRQINKTKIRKRPTSSNQNQSLSHERLEPRCMLAGAGIAGTLDLNFGVNGFATINPEDGSTGGGANSVAIQSDGKIVVGGYTYVASPAHAALSLARFNTDGTLDATFGTNGIYTDSVVRNLSISYGEFQFAVAIRDIAIDSQGRIVWGGDRYGIIGRANSDGTRDNGFGNQSWQGFDGLFWAHSGSVVKLLPQPDGSVISVARLWTGAHANIAIQKVTSGGQFDTSFGTQNVEGWSNVDFSSPSVIADENPLDAAQTADGKFVVVGSWVNQANGDNAPFVVRFNSNGTLDNTFGNGGQLLLHDVPNAHRLGAGSIAITSQGKYLITLTGEDFSHVAQLNSDGTLDTSFGGGDGVADVNENASLRKMALQADGKIVLAGSDGGAATWRLNTDGSPDVTYQNNPYSVPSFAVAPFPNHGNIHSANDLAIQANGQIVIVGANFYWYGEPIGTKGYAYGVARISNGAQPVAVSGRVYDDLNNDGGFQSGSGEVGLGGIAVTLTGTDISNNSVNRSTSTLADGTFSFDGVLPGTYSLTSEQSIGFLDGKEAAGNLGGGINHSADSNTVSGIVVGNDGIAATDYLFGELRPSEISGLVWEDFNVDGQVNFGERAIDNAQVTLAGTDDRGNAVNLNSFSDDGGIYMFYDLRPGTYGLTESQPIGFNDAAESLGTVDGSAAGIVAGNDQFGGIAMGAGAVGINYNFAERPLNGGQVSSGQTATIGFWQNNNGRALILALNCGANSTQLSSWLAATLPNMYGTGAGANNLTGKTNMQVWDFYNALFRRKQKEAQAMGLGGPTKTDAQVFATALAVYVTNGNLAGTTGTGYGFVVSQNGVGASTFNVGSSGQAFGVANGSVVSVMDLLLAANARSRNGVLYDMDGDGDANDSLEINLRTMLNNVFSTINESGNR